MSRILLLVLTLFFFQCSSQKRASNNYLFRGVNNPKTKKGNIKVGKNKSLYMGVTGKTKKGKLKVNHKSLFKGATSSNKKNVKTSTHKSLYKSSTAPNVNIINPKRMNDIQYKSAYKADKKGKKNRKHFKKKKN
ncbi:hypothetical protein ACFLU5_05085 [Bacteroidota bacterium]